MKVTKSKWLDEPRIVCGLMTGTSLDGIDCALVKFYCGENRDIKFELLQWDIIEFTDTIRSLIINIIEKPAPVSLFSDLNFLLSHLYYDAINLILQKAGIPLSYLDAIGIHGQTVWHKPEPTHIVGYEIASTLQIGSISALSALIQKPVVGDFRSNDIALGGQGAPLVPIFDYSFLASKEKNVIALNIGGISNLTIIPRNATKDIILAFDTGPGNIFVDMAMQKLYNTTYDNNGEIASKGKLINNLFLKLKEIEFIYKQPPKSTGREYFSRDLFNSIVSDFVNVYPNEDIIHTLTFFSSWNIAENIRRFAIPESNLIVSGGGALNNNLIELLKRELPNTIIEKSDKYHIPVEAKEAICFAYLACLRILEIPSNLPPVTGASRESILGVLALP